MIRLFACLTTALALAACASGMTPEFDPVKARLLAELENQVAVGKPGAKVCRLFQVGISEHNLVKGAVSAVQSGELTVIVEDPGRFPLNVEGKLLEKGSTLHGPSNQWAPCT